MSHSNTIHTFTIRPLRLHARVIWDNVFEHLFNKLTNIGPTLTEREKEIKQLESSLFASNFYYTNTSNSRATFKFWRFCDIFLKFLCVFITIWNVSSYFYKLVVELLKSDFFSICIETVNSGTWSQPVLNERITETIHSYSNYWELSRAENSSVDSVA